MWLAHQSIFLFDLGEAISPSRPQFDCAAVSSGGQGWPPFAGHPKGLSLTAASTVAGFGAPGEETIITTSRFRFLYPYSVCLGSGHRKPIKDGALGPVRKRDSAQPLSACLLWRRLPYRGTLNG